MIFDLLLGLLLFNTGLVLVTHKIANLNTESYLIITLIIGFSLCLIGYSILFASLCEVVM